MSGFAEHDSSDRRRNGRLRCESLRCNLGTVVNLSGTGARIRRRFGAKLREAERVEVRIGSRLGELRMQGQVVWIRRVGWLGFEAGVHFLDLSASSRTLLTDIAREHHDRRVLSRAA